MDARIEYHCPVIHGISTKASEAFKQITVLLYTQQKKKHNNSKLLPGNLSKILVEFYDKKVLIVFCFLSTMRDMKCQIQFTGIRCYTINIKSTKIDVSVSETPNSVDFGADFNL